MKMEGGFLMLVFALILLTISPDFVICEYHTEGIHHHHRTEKVTKLHFYFHDIVSGDNPTAVLVAQSNNTSRYPKSKTPFSSVFVIDNILTEGPKPTSKVIGNAQGISVMTGQDEPSIVFSVDYQFTTGKFNGSSIIVSSRNPITSKVREVAVVGGRGKFRLARGFATLKTYYFNQENGDATVEYTVTVYHY